MNDNIELNELYFKNEKFKSFIDLVGPEKTKEILREFGGNSIYIPKTMGTKHYKEYIKTCIGKKSVSEIARELNITPRTVFRHLK